MIGKYRARFFQRLEVWDETIRVVSPGPDDDDYFFGSIDLDFSRESKEEKGLAILAALDSSF